MTSNDSVMSILCLGCQQLHFLPRGQLLLETPEVILVGLGEIPQAYGRNKNQRNFSNKLAFMLEKKTFYNPFKAILFSILIFVK